MAERASMTDEVSLDDWQLLRRFTEHNSQEAFAALTARYLTLVYSVCRRELADDETAEDVTQAVFLILARKAPALRRGVVLSGWLFQTARFVARNARLQAQRRSAYEQKAAQAMQQQSEEREDAAWSEIEPLLNQSLAALRGGERECVLLRFFQGLSFAEAGAALGLSEEAARKRVTRVLEKMRKFFEKGRVIVPGTALAALLTAHAAKAAPATCSADIASVTVGILAGHLPVGLTGSHIYQLSEGALKAMKMAQIKVAVGIAATLVVGFSTYAAAKKIPLVTKTHRVAQLTAAPKPGHALVQAPGKTLTAPQIAARCREAYAALESYQGTSTVITQTVNGSDPTVHEYHTAATIQFVRPGKIRADGRDTNRDPFTYVSDGAATAYRASKGVWKPTTDAGMAVASVTGIALNAATTIPSVLLDINWGNPLAKGTEYDPEVREDDMDGLRCYILTTHTETAAMSETRSVWVDAKTFLLRRSASDSDGVLQMPAMSGQASRSVAMKSHDDQRFTNERLNETIPDGTFTVPVAQ